VGVHPFFAKIALTAGGDARYYYPVSLFELRDSIPNLFDDSDTFVPENPTGSTGRNVPFQDVKIRTANSRLHHFNDCIIRLL
jgi:hypothetical protein